MQECTGTYFFANDQLSDVSSFVIPFSAHAGYVYEVFRVMDGIPLFIEDHLDRLFESASLIRASIPASGTMLLQRVRELIDANKLSVGNIKVVFMPADAGPGSLYMYVNPHQYPGNREFMRGVPVTLFEGVRTNPNAKVMDGPLRQKTNHMKAIKDVHETLLVDQQGFITEGSRSNVFFIIHDEVVTPPLKDVLPGITRKHIIGCCLKEGIPFREGKVAVDDLAGARAAFLTGTSRKVLPIKRINDMAMDPAHPLIRQVSHAFNNKVAVYLLKAALERENLIP